MKRLPKFAIIAASLAFVSACATQPKKPPATASDISRTSLCLLNLSIPTAVAPVPDADDPGNKYDSEPTVLRIFEVMGMIRGACNPPNDSR